MHKRTFEDAFNLLCGRLIGRGISRKVFECRLRPEFVVKVEIIENDEARNFANVIEDKFYSDNEHYKPVAKWLAPIEFLSPDGRLMLQRRVQPINPDQIKDLPRLIPSFLTDVKTDNFGWFEGRLVSVDCAFSFSNPSTRLKKANW